MTRNERLEWREWQRERVRRYRSEHPEKCSRCGGPKYCARCQAWWRERGKPGKHDTGAHAAMLLEARDLRSRCAVTGATLRQLAAVGLRLEVDRIDPTKGYRPGNMRLVASTVNQSKGNRREPLAATVARVVALVGAA